MRARRYVMCASSCTLSAGCCLFVSLPSRLSSSRAVNRFSNGRGSLAGGAQSKSITGASLCDRSRASQRRTTSSTALRRCTANFPPQRHGLAGLEVVAGQGDDSVARVVGTDQVLGGGDFGSVGLFFDGGAVEEHVDSVVADIEGEVARVARDGLAPVVVVDELPATAGVGD